MTEQNDNPTQNGAVTVYLTANQLRARYGGVSHMWLWRRIHDHSTGFPQPKYFGRLRFWDSREIEAWERTAAAASKAA